MDQALAVEQSNNPPDRIRKIDLAEAFKLRFKNNLSFQAIADHFGCTKQSVFDALAPFSNLIKNSTDTSIYEANKAGILTAVQFELVKQMADKGKLKAASLNNIAYSLSQLDNMIRLEKGQPTAITEHLDADLGGMIDQLCGLKPAGSGSTIDVSGNSDTPAAASLPSSPEEDILSSLLPAVPADPGTFTPDKSTTPAADRSTCGNLDHTNSPAHPTKRGNRGKYAPRTTTKSATNSRKQNSCNITATLDSKIDTVKQGTNSIKPADTTSAAGKEWYE